LLAFSFSVLESEFCGLVWFLWDCKYSQRRVWRLWSSVWFLITDSTELDYMPIQNVIIISPEDQTCRRTEKTSPIRFNFIYLAKGTHETALDTLQDVPLNSGLLGCNAM
jgi:hypothetical protein